MNWREIIEAGEVKMRKHKSSMLWSIALEASERALDNAFAAGWDKVDLSKQANTSEFIPALFETLRTELQFVGARMCSESEAYNDELYKDLTEILAVFREVFMKNFQVELPEARVVSLTTGMVEAGFFKQKRGKEGQLYVSVVENPFSLKIKIIKIPKGPAPEEIKEKWLELKEPLPARQMPGGEGYEVPLRPALKILYDVSQEGALWFAENFGRDYSIRFRQDEVEVVP